MDSKQPQQDFFKNPFSSHKPTLPLGDDERVARIQLIRSRNIGPVGFAQLIEKFGTAKDALIGLRNHSLGSRKWNSIRLYSKADAETELVHARNIGVTPLFLEEPNFPSMVRQISAPPPLIYAHGNLKLLHKPTLAIVGSRLASAVGLKVVHQFSRELGQRGLIICSGLARGIDAEAHRAALPEGTIAVVAGGVDVVYPPEHNKLHQHIAEQGCIVSSMPCGFKPRAKDFPRRNRIIAGLSLGVLIIEAAKRSGTLTTARWACELNREVFAVPGHPLDPRAVGTNLLLKNGATLATHPDDILEILKPLTSDSFRKPQLEPETAPALSSCANSKDSHAPTPEPFCHDETTPHQTVISLLGYTPTHVDELVATSGYSVPNIRATLTELELEGKIERHADGFICLKPSP